MMALRSNACHYWTWVAKQKINNKSMDSYPNVKNFLALEAMVVGDLHHENFSHLFVEEKRVYVVNDIDDAGIGPVYLDFLKFLAVSRALLNNESQLKTSKMLQHYTDGFAQVTWPKELPQLIRKDHDVSYKDFLNDYADKIKESIKNDEFKADDGLIRWKKMDVDAQNFFLNLEESIFSRHLPENYQILDRANYLKIEGGGSAGLLRYVYLLGQASGQKHLIEFKPLHSTALEAYNPNQLEPFLRATKAIHIFWPFDHTNLVKIVSDSTMKKSVFLMRPKYKNYINLSKSDFVKQTENVSELSYYIAHTLGLIHGSQFTSNKEFAELIESNEKEFTEFSQKFVESYLQEVKKQIN